MSRALLLLVVALAAVTALQPPRWTLLGALAGSGDTVQGSAGSIISSSGWYAADGPRQPSLQDAVAVASEDGIPLYPCRGSYGNGVQIGRIRADFHGCHIGYGGHEVEVAPYEVLGATWADAASGDVPAGASTAGADPALNAGVPFQVMPLAACRAAWHGGLQIGELRDGGCIFGFGGEQVAMDRYQVLLASPWMTWTPGTPAALSGTAIAGGRENGVPLYVCRAAVAGGLHVGKIGPSAPACSVTDGRREVVAERFELLVPRWRTGTAGSLPVNALPQGRENGVSLYLCRAQRGGAMQIGKVGENLDGCHIGMQGGEAVAGEFEVLGE